MDDFGITKEERLAILIEEMKGIKRQIYDLSVSIEGRKFSGFNEQENAGLQAQLEKEIKLRDFFTERIKELQ